ncbi:MAG: DUF5916 domain-containing protein [Candidatus Aminicenantaceae bacterium]
MIFSQKKSRSVFFLGVFLWIGFRTPVYSVGRTDVPEAEVLRLSSSESIRLDGLLDESFWRRAVPIGPFRMVEPDEDAEPSEKTEVRVAVTLDAIYFGIVCYDSAPEKIISFTMQRDAELRGEDHIKIVLDTFLNGRTGYVFAVNPNGARVDGLIAREGEGEDRDWDGIWEAAVLRRSDGWSAEIYIPVKTLRFQVGLDRWGFNVERRIERNLETDRWATPIRNFKVTHISQGGLLTSIPEFQQGLGLTVRPYMMGSLTREDPSVSSSSDFRPGLDVLKNFGGNVTGLISVNTDFAETEVDTRRVNLTRFPLFFPEKRTFFLEGSDIFNFGLGMGFYRDRDVIPFFSRRIGLLEGEAVPLDFSIKATGTLGGLNFGILDSFTRSVEGLTSKNNLFAARASQNLWAESRMGVLVTAGDPIGRGNSWLIGGDFVYKTSKLQGNKNLMFGVWGLVTNREGLGTDRSALGVAVDFPNDLWDISFNAKRIGADFDPSLGFVPWRGIYKANLNFMYKPRPDWPWLRQMRNGLYSQIVTDLDGKVYQWRIFLAPLNWSLESGDRIEFNIVPYMERVPEPFDLTDDVYVDKGTYHWTRYRIELTSSSKRRFTGKLSWWFGNFYDGNMNQYQADVTWRLSHKFNISLEGEKYKVSLPSGLTDILLVTGKLNIFINPDFQIISYLQYDNQSRSLGMNTRIRWTYRSLLDVFLVYNRNWLEIDNRFSPMLNQFFIKIQYSFRR